MAKKFEYKIVQDDEIHNEEDLTILGKEGWELVSAICYQTNRIWDNKTFYFKRDITLESLNE